MDTKVKEFIEAAKLKERKVFEKERDEHLLSLGLIDEEKSIREYSVNYSSFFNKWDKKAQKYYREELVPAKITDEEYEEVKRYAAKNAADMENVELNNGAEKFLGIINTIMLVLSIIAVVVLIIVGVVEYEGGLFLIALSVLLISLISWAVVKVVLNISNNLHEINSKLK